MGGPPGSGKTTLALRLVRRHGLRWYGSDTRTWEHRDRALAAGSKAAAHWESLTPTQRQEVSPEDFLQLTLQRERGPMVADDVHTLPASPLVVAEGTPLPAAIAAADPARALWLLPALDPGDPRASWLLLAQTIEQEASRHGIPVLEVDRGRPIDATVALAEAHFAAALAAGPRAESLSARRALLREANECVVHQVRGYYARAWAEGDADVVVRRFVCECGDRDCTEDLEVPLGIVAQGPALAPGHD